MLEAKNIQCGNLVDVDSNFNIAYQLIDGLRESQPQTLYLRNTSAQYGGYNSEYTDVAFASATTNFESSALSFNSVDSTINVDNSVYTDYAVRCTIQYYTPSTTTNKIIYIKFVEIDGNGNETTINPFYRVPVGSTTTDGQKLISFNQIFSVQDDTKKIKLQITTNDTNRPSVSNIALEITGVCKSMN